MTNSEHQLAHLRREADEAIARHVDSLSHDPALAQGDPSVLDAVRAFLATGGKRMRPVLFLLVYRGYGGRSLQDATGFAVALELLHSFALIHDDLIDGTTRRRGHPALSQWFSQRLPQPERASAKPGRDLALLTGDVLYAAAIEAAQSVNAPPGVLERTLAVLLRTAVETGAGACQEVRLRQQPIFSIDRDAILEIYDRKTVRYSFECPLRTAALLAQVPRGPEEQRLHSLAQCLGVAYQIHDDIADLFAFLDDTPDAAGMTLCETKLMLPLYTAVNRAANTERQWVRDLFARETATTAERARLKQLVETTEALSVCRNEATRLLDQAKEYIQGLEVSCETRQGLSTFADRLHSLDEPTCRENAA